MRLQNQLSTPLVKYHSKLGFISKLDKKCNGESLMNQLNFLQLQKINFNRDYKGQQNQKSIKINDQSTNKCEYLDFLQQRRYIIINLFIKMLLKWQSIILNRLYQTTLFDRIITKSNSIESINYNQSLNIYQQVIKSSYPKSNINIQQFINAAHTLCKSKSIQQKRQKIIFFNQIINSLHQQQTQKGKIFGYYHVIAFSSLSKCTIWPGMFKTSQKLLPSLIQFYSSFHNQFKTFLEYKFDPLILSTKFNKVVKNIKQKRLANPQLFQAVSKNNIENILKIAANQPQIINDCIKDGLYITHYAAIHSNIQTLKFLLSIKADFELLDLEEQTPIFYAVKRFDLQIVKFFVEEAKVNINHTEYQNRTPIYLAAFEGKLDIVDYLYSKGADPQIQSKLARTPLSKACYLGNVKVAEYLIKLGVRIQSIDSKGRTALHNAAWGIQGGRQGKRRGHIKLQDSPQCAELLIKAGHKIDFQDYDKFTPLFSAISSHAERSLRLLVNYGANLKHKTIKNETALFIASKYGHLKIIKILLEEYNCDFLQQNNQGYSPLAASFTLDESQCTHYLLDVYMQHKISCIKLKDIFKCLIQYKKIKNYSYIVEWMKNQTNEQKNKYIAENIDNSFEELINYVFKCEQIQIKGGFFKIVKAVQKYLKKQTIIKLFEAIQYYQFYNNETLNIILSQSKEGHKICMINLNESIQQDTVLQVLSMRSNLTDNLDNLYQTFVKLIQMRYTKAILYLLRGQMTNKDQLQTLNHIDEGQIVKLLFSRINGKISINDFCLVHGHYDVHKIINSFYQDKCHQMQHQLNAQRPIIPSYQFNKLQSKQVKAYLYPIQNLKEKLTFEYLVANYLSKQDLQIYQDIVINKGAFKINPNIVKTQKDLLQTIQKMQNKRLVGIDIEHYSSNSQSFICLIQISTFQQVFIVDRFNFIDQQLTIFLNTLFKNKQIIKIFHSYDNDLKWLVEDYHIEEFHNILDTARIYSSLGNQKNNTPSLKFLAQHFLGFQMKKEYQKSDWRIRPLFNEMLQYAGTDAKILPFILLKMIEIFNSSKLNKECIKVFQAKRMIKSTNWKNLVKLL